MVVVLVVRRSSVLLLLSRLTKSIARGPRGNVLDLEIDREKIFKKFVNYNKIRLFSVAENYLTTVLQTLVESTQVLYVILTNDQFRNQQNQNIRNFNTIGDRLLKKDANIAVL
jgi:hypothetical protein